MTKYLYLNIIFILFIYIKYFFIYNIINNFYSFIITTINA